MNMPARLLAALPSSKNSVLIQTYGYGIKGAFNDAYRMNTKSGDLDRVASSPMRDGTFIPDFDNRVQLVNGVDLEGGARPSTGRGVRPSGSSSCTSRTSTAGSTAPFAPWTKDEYLAYDDTEASTTGIYTFNPETKEKTLLFRDPVVDVGPPSVDPTGKPWMFRVDGHFVDYWYPDPSHPLAEVHKWLRALIPDSAISITSTTDDMAYGVVRVTSPRVPVLFFYADFKNRKLLQQLLGYPDLKIADLADVEPIEFKARDGLKIRGYLTVPNGPTKKKLPLIVLVHGGPHGRPLRQQGLRLLEALRLAWHTGERCRSELSRLRRSRLGFQAIRLPQVGSAMRARHHRWREMGDQRRCRRWPQSEHLRRKLRRHSRRSRMASYRAPVDVPTAAVGDSGAIIRSHAHGDDEGDIEDRHLRCRRSGTLSLRRAGARRSRRSEAALAGVQREARSRAAVAVGLHQCRTTTLQGRRARAR